MNHEVRYLARRPAASPALSKIGDEYHGRGRASARARAAAGVIRFDDLRACPRDSYAVRGMGDRREHSEAYRQGNLLARDRGDRRRPLFRIRKWSEHRDRDSLRRTGDDRGVANGTLRSAYAGRRLQRAPERDLHQNYRYAEERMMRMMAGWIALTPQMEVKLEMAQQVYEDALHADALGKRLPELRAQTAGSKPPNEEFVTFMNAIEDKEEWEDTIERLVGIYRVLKPHLISHYSAHVDGDESGLRAADHCASCSGWSRKKRCTSSAAGAARRSARFEARSIGGRRNGKRIWKNCWRGGRRHGLRDGRAERRAENRAQLSG